MGSTCLQSVLNSTRLRSALNRHCAREPEEPKQIATKSKGAAFTWSNVAIETLEEEQSIKLGTEVIIEGLVKAPSFNGALGVVQSFDVESGRYNVLLDGGSPGQRWAKIKGENLRQASPRKAYR